MSIEATKNTPDQTMPPKSDAENKEGLSKKNYKYGPEDKLQYEVEKISEEVKILKKPYLQPTFWIGIVALTISLGSNVGQCIVYNGEAEKRQLALDKADNQRIKAEIDKAKAEEAKANVLKDQQEIQQKTDLAVKERDAAKQEFNNIQDQIADLRKQAAEVKKSSSVQETRDSLNTLEQSLIILGKKADNAKTSFSIPPTRLQTALAKEREGFQNLVKGDYAAAITGFQSAEEVYPRFHNVYELAKILRENQAKMANPEDKKRVFQTIVQEYSYGAPADLWQQVVEIAGG